MALRHQASRHDASTHSQRWGSRSLKSALRPAHRHHAAATVLGYPPIATIPPTTVRLAFCELRAILPWPWPQTRGPRLRIVPPGSNVVNRRTTRDTGMLPSARPFILHFRNLLARHECILLRKPSRLVRAGHSQCSTASVGQCPQSQGDRPKEALRLREVRPEARGEQHGADGEQPLDEPQSLLRDVHVSRVAPSYVRQQCVGHTMTNTEVRNFHPTSRMDGFRAVPMRRVVKSSARLAPPAPRQC